MSSNPLEKGEGFFMGINLKEKKEMDLEKMQKEAEKLESEFKQKKTAIIEEMKKCPDCKETDVAFIPCEKHFKSLSDASDEYMRKSLAIKLKMEIHPEETQQEIERLRRKYMQTASPCESCRKREQ